MDPLQADPKANDLPHGWLGSRMHRLNEHHGWKFLVAAVGLASAVFGVWQYYITDVEKDVARVVHPDTAKLQADDAKIQAAIEKARRDILEDNERHRQSSAMPDTSHPATPSADSSAIRHGPTTSHPPEQQNTASETTSEEQPWPGLSHQDEQQKAGSMRTFTTTTPTAIMAPQGDARYQDKIAAASLRDVLSNSLHLTTDQINAQIVIEVSDVEVRKDITGQPCPNPGEAAFSSLTASAKMTVRMVWAGGAVVLPSQPFSNAVPTCDSTEDDLTRNLAFDHVIGLARDKILALAARKLSPQ
jgi:hypothetical protein